MNTPTPRTDYLLSDYVTVDQLIDHAREIETELTAAREALKTGGMLNIIDRAHHERAAAIRERDEARNETIRTREFMDHGFAKARDELTAVTEQRDRLAEALVNLVKVNETWNQGMMDVIGRPPNWNDSYLNEAKEALQSLTHKS